MNNTNIIAPPIMEEKTKAQQRVEIAKDILNLIENESILIECGRVISIFGIIGSKSIYEHIQSYIASNRNVCEVCAKGSLLVAHILRYNNISTLSVMGFDKASGGEQSEAFSDVFPEIESIFPDKMLAEIETLFEGLILSQNEDLLGQLNMAKLISFFNEKFDDPLNPVHPTERLKYIFQKLVDSHGEKIVLDLL